MRRPRNARSWAVDRSLWSDDRHDAHATADRTVSGPEEPARLARVAPARPPQGQEPGLGSAPGLQRRPAPELGREPALARRLPEAFRAQRQGLAWAQQPRPERAAARRPGARLQQQRGRGLPAPDDPPPGGPAGRGQPRSRAGVRRAHRRTGHHRGRRGAGPASARASAARTPGARRWTAQQDCPPAHRADARAWSRPPPSLCDHG